MITRRPDWRKYYNRQNQMCQWTMASRPGHPVLREVLNRIVAFNAANPDRENISAVESTGPAIWSDAVAHHVRTSCVGAARSPARSPADPQASGTA